MTTSGEQGTGDDGRSEGGVVPDPRRTTVHEAMRLVTGADAVFRRFGIDACCGGELPLAEAAAAHEVELERLVAVLEEAGARDGG